MDIAVSGVKDALRDYELFVAKHMRYETADDEVRRFAECIHRSAEKPHKELLCCPRDEREEYVQKCSVLSARAHEAFAALRATTTADEYRGFVDKHFGSRSIAKRFYRRLSQGVAAAAALALLYYLYPTKQSAEEPVLPANAARALEFLEQLGISDDRAAELLESVKNDTGVPMQRRWFHLKSIFTTLGLSGVAASAPAPLSLVLLARPLSALKNVFRERRWHGDNKLRSLLYSGWDREVHDRAGIFDFWS